MAEHPKAFDHVGLLFNKPPGRAELFFIQSSDNFAGRSRHQSHSFQHYNRMPLRGKGNSTFGFRPLFGIIVGPIRELGVVKNLKHLLDGLSPVEAGESKEATRHSED